MSSPPQETQESQNKISFWNNPFIHSLLHNMGQSLGESLGKILGIGLLLMIPVVALNFLYLAQHPIGALIDLGAVLAAAIIGVFLSTFMGVPLMVSIGAGVAVWWAVNIVL